MKYIAHPANFPNLQHHCHCTRSVFHWYDHLASIFIPSFGLEDVIWHIEFLTNFTQKALNDAIQGIALLNTEVKLMRQAVIQNRMALDILTAAQGGTCAIIKVECCVYIPNYLQNVSNSLQDLQKQIQAMSGPETPWITTIRNWLSTTFWWKSILLIGLIIIPNTNIWPLYT